MKVYTPDGMQWKFDQNIGTHKQHEIVHRLRFLTRDFNKSFTQLLHHGFSDNPKTNCH